MNNINHSKNQLLDIVMPPAPPEAVSYTSITVISISIGLIVILGLLQLYKSNFKYRIRISRLQKELQASLITPQQAAYQLANILKSAHKTNDLKNIDAGNTKEKTAFLTQLSNYRYSSHKIELSDILNLMDDAKHWLKRRPL